MAVVVPRRRGRPSVQFAAYELGNKEAPVTAATLAALGAVGAARPIGPDKAAWLPATVETSVRRPSPLYGPDRDTHPAEGR